MVEGNRVLARLEHRCLKLGEINKFRLAARRGVQIWLQRWREDYVWAVIITEPSGPNP